MSISGIKNIWDIQGGGSSTPADLVNRVQAVETKATSNETSINNLNTEAVKLSGTQNISGVKTITATGEALKFNSGTNDSAYMSGYNSGNQRIWYFGKGSSASNDFYIGADRGTVVLETSNNIHLKAQNVIHCNNKKLTNVAEPATTTDATTKQYVDNKIQKRIITQTINQNTTYTITPANGYEIISVMVGRKRSSDNYYFFTHNNNLNFQVFITPNNEYKIYTNGSVTDFNNEYKIIVLEKKV